MVDFYRWLFLYMRYYDKQKKHKNKNLFNFASDTDLIYNDIHTAYGIRKNNGKLQRH